MSVWKSWELTFYKSPHVQ